MTDTGATSTPCVQYACYKCRRILFPAAVLMKHAPGHVTSVTFAGKKASNSALSHSTCSSYFVDPDSLAIGAFTDNEGKLNCPHCRAKLGSFTWSGEQCSCGRWVTPAFMFNKSKVDEKRAGQTTDGGRGGVALRPPVIVFKPQLDAGSSGGDSAVDEHKQMAEDDSKRQSISPLPQSI